MSSRQSDLRPGEGSADPRRNTRIVIWCAILLALAGIGVLAFGARQPASKPVPELNSVRTIDVMHALEIRLEELYGAVARDDWKKAEFALERLEQTAARLYGKDIYWQEANVSLMAEALLQQRSADLRPFIAAKDQEGFVRMGRDLIAACNACHQATQQIVFVQEPPVEFGIRPAEGH